MPKTNFLQIFHTAGNGYAAEVDALADRRSPAQARLMDSLIGQIMDLDTATGAAARDWTDRATAAGHWTPGREGTASAWIGRMISKHRELAQAGGTAIPNGYYAVETDKIRCYRVADGWLRRISSDDEFPVRSAAARAVVFAAIAADVDAAAVLAARTLRRCRRCGRRLSDASGNPFYGVGLGPECGAKG